MFQCFTVRSKLNLPQIDTDSLRVFTHARARTHTQSMYAVSYTHLDVYKRQVYVLSKTIKQIITRKLGWTL